MSSSTGLNQVTPAPDPLVFCETEEILENYRRNETVIDLSRIPDEIRDSVISAFEAEAGKGKSKVLRYFIDNRLNLLMDNINDF